MKPASRRALRAHTRLLCRHFHSVRRGYHGFQSFFPFFFPLSLHTFDTRNSNKQCRSNGFSSHLFRQPRTNNLSIPLPTAGVRLELPHQSDYDASDVHFPSNTETVIKSLKTPGITPFLSVPCSHSLANSSSFSSTPGSVNLFFHYTGLRQSLTSQLSLQRSPPHVFSCYLRQAKLHFLHTHTLPRKTFTFFFFNTSAVHWQKNAVHTVQAAYHSHGLNRGEEESGGGFQSSPVKWKRHVKQRKRDAGCQKGRSGEKGGEPGKS